MYSISEVSSLEKRYVGDCQVRADVIRRGSMEVSIIGFLRRISRVVRRELSDLFNIFIVTIWSQTGTIELFGLQESSVNSSGKSAVISQIRREESAQSSKGVTRRLILHSGCSGSQVYSESDVSSF